MVITRSLLSHFFKMSLLVLAILGTSSIANAHSIKEHATVTALTLNFARLTRWPIDSISQSINFNLCVIGHNTVQQSFARINHQIVHHKVIQVLTRSYRQDLSECHLVYISDLKQATLHQVLLKLQNKPILTIGKGFTFIQAGGMASFALIQGKTQLNINLATINQSRLVVSSRLLKLGKIFSFPFPSH